MLEDLREVLEGLESPLADLTGTLSALASTTLAAATGFGNASGQFQVASSAMSGVAQSAMTKVGAAGKDAAAGIKELGSVVKTLASADLPSAKQAMAMVGAALGGIVTSGADKAAQALSKLGPEGEAAGAALQGLAAAFAAVIGLMAQFMGMAIESAQKADMMRDRFAALAGGIKEGKAVQEMLGKLNLPFGPQVNEWAQALLAAGIKGKQLEADIRAVAAATALMGEQGGAAAMTLFKRLGDGGPAADSLLKTFKDGGPKADKLLKEMGLSIADIGGQAALAKMTTEQLHEALAKAMQKKGKGPLEDMALTLPVILGQARAGFLSLFGGVQGPVKAFMQAVKSLFSEFNKGSPLIKGLKPVFTEALSTLFSWATKGVNALHALLNVFIGSGKSAGVLSGAVSMLKAGWTAMSAIWKASTTALAPIIAMLKAIWSNALVMNGIRTIFTVIGGVIVGVVVVVAALVAAFATAAGAIAGVFGALAGLAAGALGAASDFIGGLIDGISAGAGAVVAAVANLAKGALGAFKGVLGIASHSKVLKKHGDEDMAGAVGAGVDRGAGKATKAMARMGAAAAGALGKTKGSRGEPGDRAGPYIDLRGSTFYGGADEGSIRSMIERIWEEVSGEAGASPEPA